MKPPPLVTSRLVPFMLWRLGQLGRPTRPLLRTFGLTSDAAAFESVQMTLPRLAKFSEAAATLAGDDDFGLTLASLLPRGHYGAVEFAARTAETMRAALETLLQTQGLPGEPIRFEAAFSARRVTIRQIFEESPGGMGRHGNEFSMATLVRAAREIVGEGFKPRRVWFAHPSPTDIGGLVRFFGTEDLTFRARENGLAFDATWLDTSARHADAPLHEVLRRQLPVQNPGVPSEQDGAAAVQRIIADLLRTGGALVTVERVASRLGCSGRSLQRRITHEGKSFRALVQEARMHLAEECLRTTRDPIVEVAERVGFYDARSFARAFRRWSGMSPGQFRTAAAREDNVG